MKWEYLRVITHATYKQSSTDPSGYEWDDWVATKIDRRGAGKPYSIGGNTGAWLDELGEQGWELGSVSDRDSYAFDAKTSQSRVSYSPATYTFKRPRHER